MNASKIRPAVIVPVLLVVAAVLHTVVGPPGRPRRPPDPLPAELDSTFLEDLERLAPALPDGATVAVRPPHGAEGISSWYWTMAAFEHPAQVWARATGGAVPAGLLVAPKVGVGGIARAPLACGEAWCLWQL